MIGSATLPALPTTSDRLVRRSCRAARLVLLPALPPRCPPTTPLPVSAAPHRSLPLRHPLAPAPATPAGLPSRSPSAAATPASQKTAAPCTPATSPLNSV